MWVYVLIQSIPQGILLLYVSSQLAGARSSPERLLKAGVGFAILLGPLGSFCPLALLPLAQVILLWGALWLLRAPVTQGLMASFFSYSLLLLGESTLLYPFCHMAGVNLGIYQAIPFTRILLGWISAGYLLIAAVWALKWGQPLAHLWSTGRGCPS